MKKKQRRLFYFLVILAILTIVGMAMLILSERDWSDAIFDLIILISGSVSILLAVYSERSSAKESERLSKMIHDINTIDSNISSDMHVDEAIRQKLNKIIAMDEQILEELSRGRRKTKRVGKKAPEKSK